MQELSNFIIALIGFALGVSQNATWDALTILAKRLKKKSKLNLELCLRQAVLETANALKETSGNQSSEDLNVLQELLDKHPEEVIGILDCIEGASYGEVIASISKGQYQASVARRINFQNLLDGRQVDTPLIEQLITDTLLRFRIKLIRNISSDEELLRTVIELVGLADIKQSIQSLQGEMPTKCELETGIALIREDLDDLRRDLLGGLQSLIVYVESRPMAEQHALAAEYEKTQHQLFITEVARLLSISGYLTERVGLNGIDLCAVTPDAFAINIGVICWNQMRPLEMADLSTFYSTFQQTNYQLCYLISAQPLAASGEAYLHQINNNSFRVLSYDRFVLDLISFDNYLKKLISAWEDDPCANLYIPPLVKDANGEELGDLRDFIEGRQSFNTKSRFAILGDYGTGKTTFCKHYAAALAKNYLQQRVGHQIPIYIRLGEFEICRDLLQLIYLALMREGIVLTRALLQELICRGMFYFLFDGLDEMSAETDRMIIRQNLRAIDQILALGDCSCLLTCRTHFFLDRVDEKQLNTYTLTFLASWGQTELYRYLSDYFGPDWKARLQKIQAMHNLQELAHTPLLLAMIVRSLGNLEGNHIRAGQLYQAYTDYWLEEEDRKSIMRPEQKRQFMSDVAWQMHISRRQRIHYADLQEKVKQTFNLLGIHDTDCHTGDVRTRSFLIRDESGFYYFSHKSFMEYFVAERLAKEILSDESSGYSHEYISPEIDSFLADLLSDTRAFNVLIGWVRNHPRRKVRKNAAMTLARANYSIAINDLITALAHENDIGVAGLLADALRKLGEEDHFLRFITKLEAFEINRRKQASEYSHTLFIFERLDDPKYEQAIPHLIDNLRNPNPDVRKFAAIQLGRFHSALIYDSLVEAIRDETVLRNRRYLILALGRTGDSRAIPLLQELLAQETDSVIHDDCLAALRVLGFESKYDG